MNLKRSVATLCVTLSVAFAAGQYVQHGRAWPLASSSDGQPVPRNIVPLAAGLGPAVTAPDAPAPPALPFMERFPTPTLDEPLRLALPSEPELQTVLDSDAASTDCAARLKIAAAPHAMLDLSLEAPCNRDARVVLRHAGLAITGRTGETGALFVSLPGLDNGGEVSVRFDDGTLLSAAAALPDLAGLRRFGVQWLADDAFQVHAFEDGAAYGAKGHVSAVDPHRPGSGGFLSLLGDPDVSLPMLAEIYTYPGSPAEPVDLALEAAVTSTTCGRELLGETLASLGGSLTVTDLTVAMPDCDAVGDYIVLKNLSRDLSIAAAR